jgi:ABC-type glycerol-3-phosphate transport system substrate-binding protein
MRASLGLLLVSVTIAAAACASSGPAAPPSVDVTDTWVGTSAYENVSVGSGDVRGTLKQSG